jgi:hypothetical protein
MTNIMTNKNNILPALTQKLLKLTREGDIVTVLTATGISKFRVVSRTAIKGRPNKTTGEGGTTLVVENVKNSDKQITFKLNKYTLPSGWHAVTDLEKHKHVDTV